MKKGNNEEIKQRVEQILGLPDRLENLEAGPGFFTEIQRKIHEQEKSEVSSSIFFIYKIKLQPALLSFIFLVNITTVLFFFLGTGNPPAAEYNYEVYASLMAETSTLETNTFGESIVKNFLGEVE